MKEIDLYDGLSDSVSEGDALKAGGWSVMHQLGDDPEFSWVIRVFSRERQTPEEGRATTEYAVIMSDAFSAGPLLVCDDYAEALDLVARWSPILSADVMAGLKATADDGDLSMYGTIERIGAKLAFGQREMPAVLKQQTQRDAASRRAREVRNAQKPE